MTHMHEAQCAQTHSQPQNLISPLMRGMWLGGIAGWREQEEDERTGTGEERQRRTKREQWRAKGMKKLQFDM